MAWDGREQRRKRRYGVKGSTLRYRPGAWLAWFRSPSPIYLLLNFSEDGANFISREALDPGRPLVVTLSAPSLKGSIGMRATVVWCRKSEALDAHHVGLALHPGLEAARRGLRLMLEGAILDTVDISTKSYLKEIERL